mgnify:CR=1 FL=1
MGPARFTTILPWNANPSKHYLHQRLTNHNSILDPTNTIKGKGEYLNAVFW